MPDIARSAFGMNVIMLGRRWRRLMDQDVQKIGLSDASWPPLLHLGLSGGGITQADLAARVGVDASTLVRVVAQLIATQLIERRADARDRRAHRLYLTRQGEAAVTAITQAINDLEKRALAAFSEDDVRHAAAVIRRISLLLNDADT